MKKHLKKVEAAIEASKQELKEELTQGAALKVDNMDPYVFPHLFESTKNVLKRQVPAIKDRDYEVRYLGVRGKSIDLAAAGKRLAEIINEAAGGLQVVGRLGTTLKLDLYHENPTTEPESVFLAYLAFTPDAAKIVDKLVRLDKNSVFFEVGAAPNTLVSEEKPA